MNFNLKMLNCWIGLCRGVAPLPSDIAQAGYSDKAIELSFRTTEKRECKPELIIASEQEKHSVLWEWKDGRSINLDQLERYSGATRQDLIERAFLAPTECQRHDTLLLVKGENVENTVTVLDKANLSFTVVGAFPGCFKTVRGLINGKTLSRILRDFPCNWEAAPVSFVPLDKDSPLEEVATHVMTLLLQRMLRRDSVIRSIDLCPEVCPLFSAMSTEARKDVEYKITDVFAAAADHEFAPYVEFKRLSNSASQLKINKNPFELGDDKRSRAFKRIKRLQLDFVEALARGHRKRPEEGLFDKLP